MPNKGDHTTERKKLLLQGRDALVRLLSDYAREQAVTTPAVLESLQRTTVEQFEQRAGLRTAAEVQRASSLTQLSLVDDEALDVELALEALGREIRERSEGVIGLLHGCYQQLLGDTLGDTIPPGPETVCASLRTLAENVEADRDTGLALIGNARAGLADKLDRFYRDLEQQFAHLGIRPDTRAPRAAPARTPYVANSPPATTEPNATVTHNGRSDAQALNTLQQLGVALSRARQPGDLSPAAPDRPINEALPDFPPELLARLLPPDTRPESGFPTLLSPQAGMTLLALERVFDALGRDASISPALRSRIETLRQPCLRLALQDGAALDALDHPALRCIDALADLGCSLPHDAHDHSVLAAIDTLLESVTSPTNPDTDSFEQLAARLTTLANQRRERADALAHSKRAVASGAIKWEAARVLAARALSILIEPGTPPEVRSFLDNCWLRVLTRTAYQHGQKHPDWRAQLELAHELVQAGARNDTEALQALNRALEVRLAASGLDAPQCRRALDALGTGSGAAGDESNQAVLASVRGHPEVRMLHHENGGVAYKPGAELEACFSHDHWAEIDRGALRLTGHVRPLETTRRMLMIVDPDQPLVLLASMSALAELQAQGQLTLRPSGSACARATQSILAALENNRQQR